MEEISERTTHGALKQTDFCNRELMLHGLIKTGSKQAHQNWTGLLVGSDIDIKSILSCRNSSGCWWSRNGVRDLFSGYLQLQFGGFDLAFFESFFFSSPVWFSFNLVSCPPLTSVISLFA